MKMTRIQNVFKIEVSQAHFKHRSGISQDVALCARRNNGRNSREFAGELPYTGDIRAAFRKRSQRDLTERIVSHRRAKTNAIAKRCKIVGKNSRRASERDGEILGQVLPLEFQFARQPVENQIQIQLTYDTDVESMHPSLR